MNRIIQSWTQLRASLWFVPGLMIIFSLGLAVALVEMDAGGSQDWMTAYPRVFGLGADGSRGMLTAIASSMLTVATLAFSLTLNAVTQASGQFTPRIFRNFLRDRANQFVLGYFVSVFGYCLVVLRTIRGGDESKFVPSLAVMVGLLLALGGILVLIFFIHHIASSLQITYILEEIVNETKASIAKVFPEKLGVSAESGSSARSFFPNDPQVDWSVVRSLSVGYIQSIDTDGVAEFAEKKDLVIRMERSIGQFVATGAPIVSIASNGEPVAFEGCTAQLNALFAVDRTRTIEQDACFGIRQIVDIALKALSPGINDTTTAIICIDNLGEIIGQIAGRRLPDKVRYVGDRPRVFVCSPDFDDFVRTAFDQIRISGRGNIAVLERLCDSIAFTMTQTSDPERRRVLLKQIRLIAELEDTLSTDYEKNRLSERLAEKLR